MTSVMEAMIVMTIQMNVRVYAVSIIKDCNTICKALSAVNRGQYEEQNQEHSPE